MLFLSDPSLVKEASVFSVRLPLSVAKSGRACVKSVCAWRRLCLYLCVAAVGGGEQEEERKRGNVFFFRGGRGINIQE